jgi:hypothetical protein
MKFKAGPWVVPVAVPGVDDPEPDGEQPVGAIMRNPATTQRQRPRKNPGPPEESCMVFMGSN